MMTAVDLIAQELKRRNLRLWCYGGGTIVPLFDACHRAGVETFVTRTEFGAGYAAIGASKATGLPQVVAVTSGPGATNIVTPCADAYYDSVPIVFLTGQVATSQHRPNVRQYGFQQTPIVNIVRPITIESMGHYAERFGNELVQDFMDALLLAEGQRRGPVLVDMSMDTQKEQILEKEYKYVSSNDMGIYLPSLTPLVELLHQSKKPVILAGAGCLASYQQLRRVVERLAIPVVCSLPAVGILPSDSPYFFGMVGHTGLPSANLILHRADLILALGSRLDVRQTGTETEAFVKDKKIVMVNNDLDELDNPRMRIDLKIRSDCSDVLGWMHAHMNQLDNDPEYNWLDWLSGCGDIADSMSVPDSQMARIIGEISDEAPDDCIFVTGVGSHQQHAGRHLALDYPRRLFITSSGHGCMGAGLPMALGATVETGRRVILIDGDGSFQHSLSELGTWMTHFPRIDLEVHIINNRSGGIVSQFARLNGYDPRETTWINPDFKMIAEAYGLSVKVHNVEEEGCWPILESGRQLDCMTWPEGDKL